MTGGTTQRNGPRRSGVRSGPRYVRRAAGGGGETEHTTMIGPGKTRVKRGAKFFPTSRPRAREATERPCCAPSPPSIRPRRARGHRDGARNTHVAAAAPTPTASTPPRRFAARPVMRPAHASPPDRDSGRGRSAGETCAPRAWTGDAAACPAACKLRKPGPPGAERHIVARRKRRGKRFDAVERVKKLDASRK